MFLFLLQVSREDKLPKKLCDDCVYKVELFYQFWNTTANAEKQLLQWLGEVGGLEDKPGYTTEVLDTVSNIFIYIRIKSRISIMLYANYVLKSLFFFSISRDKN